jgi:hypothetical protein
MKAKKGSNNIDRNKHFWVQYVWSSREISGEFTVLFYNLLKDEAISKVILKYIKKILTCRDQGTKT